MKRQAPEYLEDDEIRKLIQIPNVNSAAGIRNLALLLLMIDGGCNVSELVGKEKDPRMIGGLRIDDIDWDKNKIRVHKPEKDSSRTVPISPETKEVLQKWRKIRPSAKTDMVFTSLKGGKLQNRYIREFLQEYARQAGINKRVKPSMLRHTYAKKLFQKSRNIELVRERLGHIDISTTAVYALSEKEI